MTRLEILSEETGLLIEKVIFYTKKDEFFITGKEALEAMKRFGELAYLAGYLRGYEIGVNNGYLKESSRIELFYKWLKEQEEK